MPATQIDRDAIKILGVLANAPRGEYVDRNDVARLSGLPPDRVNDAVALLVEAGHAEWNQTFGTAPYDFNDVMITSRGRYEQQRIAAATKQSESTHPKSTVGQRADPGFPEEGGVQTVASILPPAPIGSPYGFTDEDWETVSERKGQAGRLYAVSGHQFESRFFDTAMLRHNIEAMLRRAVEAYNGDPSRRPLSLEYRSLSAGYGEHLFNEIARDIIGADIAVFETSDLNPNVMLEMGVALTWGVRVLPIKLEGCPKPPSDVSGQTWADYRDNAAAFVDPEHEHKLVRMIERAVRKKGRGAT
ncbi:MAG: hypothetical protein ABSH28_07500 [Acidobacteriota bacterium]